MEARCEVCGEAALRSEGALFIRRGNEEVARCSEHAVLKARKRAPSTKQQIDALAGQRKAVARGKDSLLWPATDKPPVAVGDVYPLQSFDIEITRVHVIREKGKYWGWWRAEFIRQIEEQPFLLARRGGYTADSRGALKAEDDQDASTLDRVSSEARSDVHRAAGEPPEPEAVPPQEVGELPSTVQAKARYIEEAEEAREDELRRQRERAVRAQLRSTLSGLSASSQLRLLGCIQHTIQAAEEAGDSFGEEAA